MAEGKEETAEEGGADLQHRAEEEVLRQIHFCQVVEILATEPPLVVSGFA